MKQKRSRNRQSDTVFDIAQTGKTKYDHNTAQAADVRPPVKKKQKHTGSEPGSKEAVGLRIVGGKFRGRKLQYIGDNRVRPMKDRVREAVFNLVGPAVKGMHAVDLFGGTGALAIEAVSRGAVSATILEIHLPTAALLKQNLESLDLLPQCALQKTDAFFWVKNKAEHPAAATPWIVFCSPPYSFYVDRQPETEEMLGFMMAAAPSGSVFVIESDDRFDICRLPGLSEMTNIEDIRIRHYPPAVIAVFDKKHTGGG